MKPNLPHRLLAAVFAAAVASLPVAAHAIGDEEFVGPFPSWTNVKSACGAVGNGTTDDTAAIQNCLNGLSATAPVLYFPAGTYLITQTLTLASQIYVSVIGQDPSNTTIIWAGPSGGTMLYLNGIAYSRFDRLTFNGQGKATVAVDQSYAGPPANYFDTSNEYTDDVFENTGTGLRCGNLGYGCAETSMLRDQFLNNTASGVSMQNFNALDMFIWYSLFQNNAEGVSNNPGAGNFHVYNSIFQGSTTTDIAIGNTGVFNFRNNYSTGSQIFMIAGNTGNPANITIEGNTILDTVNPVSVYVGNLGPVVSLDNTIRSLAKASGPGVVYAAGWSPTDLFSMGNTFTISPPTYASGHYHSVQDQVVARSTINPSPPTLPGTPPNLNRSIYEISPGSTTAQIQTAISAAAAGCTNNVAHIQPGNYNVTSTLTVPANCPVQIIGDGGNSQLTAAGASPVIRLLGPSKAVLRDFTVNGSNSADGIEVDNADQPGSRVFMEQSNLAWSHTNLFVDGLDYTNVELHDFYHNYDETTGMTSVVVTGGPSAAQGLWQGGATNIFAGASSGNYISYGVSNGAHIGIRDIWYDSGAGGSQAANITGTSTFTYAGSELSLPGSGSLAISLTNFQGTATLVNLNTNSDIDITGNGGTAQVLGLGLVGPSAQSFANHSSSPAATTEFLNGQTTANPPLGLATSELAEQGTADESFLAATLNQIRKEQPTMLAPIASGVTDARFYRVFVDHAIIGIHLEAASVAPPSPPVTSGSCGGSNRTKLTRAPTTSLCSAGTASSVSGSGPWAWSCAGSNGGTTASCSAQLAIRHHRYAH